MERIEELTLRVTGLLDQIEAHLERYGDSEEEIVRACENLGIDCTEVKEDEAWGNDSESTGS